MKRITLMIMFFSLLMTGCQLEQKADAIHLGLNAVILDVGKDHIVVKDPAFEMTEVFGENTLISLETVLEEDRLIYVAFDSDPVDIRILSVADLRPGDEVTVDLTEEELARVPVGKAQAHQIQLMTQRLGHD